MKGHRTKSQWSGKLWWGKEARGPVNNGKTTESVTRARLIKEAWLSARFGFLRRCGTRWQTELKIAASSSFVNRKLKKRGARLPFHKVIMRSKDSAFREWKRSDEALITVQWNPISGRKDGKFSLTFEFFVFLCISSLLLCSALASTQLVPSTAKYVIMFSPIL